MEDIIIPISDSQKGLSQYLSQEWLETNRLGGYASSTIVNCHTRKYHGLLVAEMTESRGKFVLLSQLVDDFLRQGRRFSLANLKYQSGYQIEGFNYLKEFRASLYPIFTYQCDNSTVIKKIMMPEGHNTVLIHYEFRGVYSEKLEIRPLLAMRDFHQLMTCHPYVELQIQSLQNGIAIKLYQGMPILYLEMNVPFDFIQDPAWYYQFEYSREIARGYSG